VDFPHRSGRGIQAFVITPNPDISLVWGEERLQETGIVCLFGSNNHQYR
jgi:hypothetical protein